MGTGKVDSIGKIMLESLDANCTTEELSRRSYQSRTQLYRLFQALVEETPAAMRRRLLLERAAHQLLNTATSVTDIAFDANYNSLDVYPRALRRASRITQILSRQTHRTLSLVAAPYRILFLP